MVPAVDVDESFRQREAYREGHLTEAPDLSAYDKMLEDDDDDECNDFFSMMELRRERVDDLELWPKSGKPGTNFRRKRSRISIPN